MRNILVHRYFDLDIDLVWMAVTDDLPDMKEKVKSALDEGYILLEALATMDSNAMAKILRRLKYIRIKYAI